MERGCEAEDCWLVDAVDVGGEETFTADFLSLYISMVLVFAIIDERPVTHFTRALSHEPWIAWCWLSIVS